MIGKMPDFNSSFDMVKNFWTGMGVSPALMDGFNVLNNSTGKAMVPPMTLEEIDRRINDLKTVESWLTVNLNMLRGSIQTLEVQRNTAVALKSFTDALSPEVVQTAMQSMARTAAEKMQSASEAFVARATPAAETPAPPPIPNPAAAFSAATEAVNQNANTAPVVGMWWNMLNDQFQTIARSAAAASELGKAFTPQTTGTESTSPTAESESELNDEVPVKRKSRSKSTPQD